MTEKKCDCLIPHAPSDGCAGCAQAGELYWCETCATYVADKRCPACGLKTRRTRNDPPK